MCKHALFCARHSVLANENEGAVGGIELSSWRYRTAFEEMHPRVNAKHGETAPAVVTVVDEHFRRPAFIQSLDCRIHFTGQQPVRFFPTRALLRIALEFEVKNTVYTLHVCGHEDL